MSRIFFRLFALNLLIVLCKSHGRMSDPISRGSLWRKGLDNLVNYNDNQNFCGGLMVQFYRNKGKCGLCGDNYRKPTPRAHEFGGTYGTGVIVKEYNNYEALHVKILLSANHRGNFTWDLCNLDHHKIESEECFKANIIKLPKGQPDYMVAPGIHGEIEIILKIPNGLKCKHCVLRWTYRAGNNWNYCENTRRGALGCGPQEHFRSCADISIY